MMRLILFFATILVVAVGCTSNKVDFTKTPADITIESERMIGVAVVEARSDVLSGIKRRDFAGLRRGAFGSPFDMLTESGKPFSEDVAQTLLDGLRKNGVRANLIEIDSTAKSEGVAAAIKAAKKDRTIELTIRQWLTDLYAKISVDYDLELRVWDSNGNVLAKTSLFGEKEIVSASAKTAVFPDYAGEVNKALDAKLNTLLNDPDVKAALQ